MLNERLKEIRLSKGKTRAQVADALGIAEKSYGEWETGRVTPPLPRLKKFAEYMGVTESYVMGIESTEPKKDEVNKLLERLIEEEIIKDPADIDKVADMIINAVKIDFQLKKLKQDH
jgi:Predicted transcriptional regulators